MFEQYENYLISLETRGVRLGLSRTKELLKRCGSPHDRIETIQIIGTNGKGSTSAILSKILENRCRVGLFTSPHLSSLRERIRVQGQAIPVKYIGEFIEKYKHEIDDVEASFFETMTVMAAWYFKKQKVDYAIMETGLGGRYDSVTACNSKIQAFTSISIDHTQILGPTLLDIAKEKIKAISKKSKIFSVKQSFAVEKLIREKCEEKKAKYMAVKKINKISLNLKGKHQKENASLAISISKNLLNDLRPNEVKNALKKIIWPGRNQMLAKKPDIIFDVAHNHSGFKSFIKYISFNKEKTYKRKVLLLSLQKNKEIEKIGPMLNDVFDIIYYTKTCPMKSMDFEKIKKNIPMANELKLPDKAIEKAVKNLNDGDMMAILGTHFWGKYVKSFFNICFDNI